MEQGAKRKSKTEKYCLGGLWVLTGIYGLLCMYLFYMQSVQPLDYNNRYFQSDLPYHISMVIEDGWYYSFTAYLYRLLYFPKSAPTILIAAVLAAVAAGTVLLTEKLLKKLTHSKETTVFTAAGALLLNFVMPFFWRYAGMYRYVSYQSGNIWHNSTYQCMKAAALAFMLVYLDLEETYKEKLSVKSWLSLALLLFLTTGIKPSFLTVFAPVLALGLLWDLCHKIPFKQVFLMGSTVLPACLVMFWQSGVLFGEDTGHGISFQPWYSFSLHADRPKLAVLCSLAFPLVMLLFSFRELRKDRGYLSAWIMAGIGFVEALCLVETGSRARDGNFLWGYSIALFWLYLSSFAKWTKLAGQIREKGKIMYGKAGICLVTGGVLAYQIFCGLLFFGRLLAGETYFMVQ